jgi:hypothetical protein
VSPLNLNLALKIHVSNLSHHRYSSNKDEGGVDLHTTFPKKIARSIAGVREPRRGPLSHLEAYMTVLAMINDVNIVNPGEASAEI